MRRKCEFPALLGNYDRRLVYMCIIITFLCICGVVGIFVCCVYEYIYYVQLCSVCANIMCLYTAYEGKKCFCANVFKRVVSYVYMCMLLCLFMYISAYMCAAHVQYRWCACVCIFVLT